MIHRSLLVVSTVAVLALLATPARELLAHPAAAAPAIRGPAEDTQLAKYMEDVNRGFRKLRTDLRDPAKNETSIALTREIQLLIGKSRLEKPARLAEIPKDGQAQFLLEFQKSLLEFHHQLLDLEEALLDGDNARAQELRDGANKLKSPAHKQFKPDDDKEK